MVAFKSLVGQKFSRLTVIEKMPFVSGSRKRAKWRCVCECGGETVTTTDNLRRGKTRSCGCLAKDILRANRVKHMEDKTSKEYMTWCRIKARCFNINSPKYYRYGGRGITVCDRWKDSFLNFLEDMGRSPSSKHSIERKDNNGNYELSNCKWATNIEQANNKSKCVNIEHLGETKTMKQWADHYSINYKSLHFAIKYRGKTLVEFLSKNV